MSEQNAKPTYTEQQAAIAAAKAKEAAAEAALAAARHERAMAEDAGLSSKAKSLRDLDRQWGLRR